MGSYKDIPYPQRLAVEMLHYCCWSCEKTNNMRHSEIVAALGAFFSQEHLDYAGRVLRGEVTNAEPADGVADGS